MAIKETRPTKGRRSKREIESIKHAIYRIAEEENPATCRQIFYRLVSEALIRKSEQEYKGTVVRLLGVMREQNEIPFGWISDNTRWVRRPDSFSTIGAAIKSTIECYRRALWRDQPVRAEVWCEKDALAGVLWEVTGVWDVPLMVSRGYASKAFLHSTAQAIAAGAKPAFLYHFGDHDPSGEDIQRHTEETLRRYAPDAEIHFERVAVTPAQIEEWDLPTRPTKKSDSRSRGFEGGSVDVDAIPPRKLRELAEECITRHISPGEFKQAQLIERLERRSMEKYLSHWNISHPPTCRDREND